MAAKLEQANILSSYSRLPLSLGGECVRMGTSEVTRLGATEGDMAAAADLVADVMLGQIAPDTARPKVHAWTERLTEPQFAAV